MGLIRKIDIGLGGSRASTVLLASGWQNADDYLDVELNGTTLTGVDVACRVECRVNDVSEAITPRVYNVDDATSAGAGVPCSATDDDYTGTDQIQTFSLTLAAGLKRYRLQGLTVPGVAGAYIIGSLIIGDAS